MNADGTVPGILRILPAVCLIITVGAACDSGGGMNGGDDNSPPTARLDASPTEAVVGDTIRLDASDSSDPDGDELKFGWSSQTPDGSDVSLSDKTSSEVSFVADADGEFVVSVDVSDGNISDSDEVTLTAIEQLPDQSTIEFSNTTADSDSSAVGTWTWNGEQIASGTASGTHTVPGSDQPGELCFAENEFFLQECTEVTPNKKTVSAPLEIQRKQVTVAVTPVDSSGTVRSETVTKIYEPFKSDSMTINGQGSVELPKRSGQRGRFSDLIAEEPDSDKLDRAQANGSFAADESVDLTVQLVKLPACSDSINNDGDNAIDEEDLGCANDAGTGYDPEDDNETHYVFRRTTGVVFDDSTFVSGDNDHQTAEIWTSDFPESVTVAIGEVRHWIENKRLADTSKQHFRMRVLSGESHDNYTSSQESDVVADPDTATGWRFNRVHGLHRFEGGRFYKLVAVKAQPLGSSKNMAIFFAGRQNLRTHAYEYFFEKDHPKLQDDNSKAATLNSTTLKNGKCVQVNDGMICKNAGNPTPPW